MAHLLQKAFGGVGCSGKYADLTSSTEEAFGMLSRPLALGSEVLREGTAILESPKLGRPLGFSLMAFIRGPIY